MSMKWFLYGVGGLALAWGHAQAGDPVVSSFVGCQTAPMVAPAAPVMATTAAPAAPAAAPAAMPSTPQTPSAATSPTQPGQQNNQDQNNLFNNQNNNQNNNFSQAPPAGGEAAASANPGMIGDSLAYITGGSRIVSSSGSVISGSPVSSSSRVTVVRSLAGSSFKIADNESPIPQDRVFLNTDYFTRVLHEVRSAGGNGPQPSLRLAREVFGFEKTFADGDASIEARVPFFQLHDDAGGSFSDFGDLTLVLKYAVVNERSCDGDMVLSGGVALTLPTGPNDVVGTTSINPFIAQPFVGYLMGGDGAFVHGFSSVAIPFSDPVPSVWFNDIGVGYYAYKGDGCIRQIVPTVEGHLTTPLGHQGSQGSPVGVIDTLVVTGGVNLVFANHALLTFGYEFPITGPQPFESEYVVQFNWKF